MEAVAVTLDCQATVVVAFDHHVYAVSAHADLRYHPVAAPGQFIVHVTFKTGLAQLAQIADLFGILSKGGFEVLNQTTAQSIDCAEVGELDTAHQVHAVPRPGRRHVEALGNRVAAVGKAVAGGRDQRKEHHVALLALESTCIATADLEPGDDFFAQFPGQGLHDGLCLLGPQ